MLAAEGLVDSGPSGEFMRGLDDVIALAAPFTPEAVEGVTGVAPAMIRRLARELAAAPTACVYGRIGTTTAEFGTLASWLVDVVNAATGNLDRPGGAMFPKPAIGSPNTKGAPRVVVQTFNGHVDDWPRHLAKLVEDTVWHEVAHYFGLNEREVRAAEKRRPGHSRYGAR